MRHGVAGKLVATGCLRAQLIPSDLASLPDGSFTLITPYESTCSHLLVRLIQHTIGLFHILSLVVKLSSTSMEIKGSFVTQKANRRCTFEEVVLVCRNASRFLDDRFRRPSDEGAVVPRAWNVCGDNEESGRKAEAVHDRHRYAKLIDRSVVIRERDCPVLAVLPFCNFRLADLADDET